MVVSWPRESPPPARVADCLGDTVVANVSLGHRLQPSEHEKLFRELLPPPVADAYLDLVAVGQRVLAEHDVVGQELITRQLAYLHRSQGTETLRPVDPLIATT